MFDVDARMAHTGVGRLYDVSRDGRRFLAIKAAAPVAPEGLSSRVALTLVQNWFEELKRRVPTR